MIITAEGPKSNPAGQSRGRDSRHAQPETGWPGLGLARYLAAQGGQVAEIDATRHAGSAVRQKGGPIDFRIGGWPHFRVRTCQTRGTARVHAVDVSGRM